MDLIVLACLELSQALSLATQPSSELGNVPPLWRHCHLRTWHNTHMGCAVHVRVPGGLVRVVWSAWRSSLWVDAAVPEGGAAKEGRASGASHTGGWGGNRRVAFSRCTAAGAGALTDGVDQCHQQAHRGGCGIGRDHAHAPNHARVLAGRWRRRWVRRWGDAWRTCGQNASTAEGVPARRSSRGGIISGRIRFPTRPSSV